MSKPTPPPSPYPALAVKCKAVHEDKRSVFTALLRPIANREQAMAELEAARKHYPGASHYCWAYLIGSASQPRSQAFNDDGEPSGTAGKPILHVLTQREAGDCMAIVVRTFGGVKLGAGGLVRAYGAAVSQALDKAQWYQVEPADTVEITVDFPLEERIRHCLSQHQLTVLSADYGQRVGLRVSIPQADQQSLQAQIQELTSGRFDWIMR